MDDALLFTDLSRGEFNARYYRKVPVLVRQGAETLLGRRFGYEDFERWRERMQCHYPPYLRGDGDCMAVIVRASSVAPELHDAAARHAPHFEDVVCAIDAFRTGEEPGGSVGAHFDDQDNFIVQQEGKKLWKVAAPPHVHPRSLFARACEGRKIGRVILPDDHLEFVLEPADVLYIPSFWIHWGIGLGRSLSLSLALNPVDTGRWLREHPEWTRVAAYIGHHSQPCAGSSAADDRVDLGALEAFAVETPRPSAKPLLLGGIELGALIESASRGSLGRLIAHVPVLAEQPIESAIVTKFLRSLTRFGEIDSSVRCAFIFTNLFVYWSERALEAIVFADSYQLAELADALGDICAELESAGMLDVAALLELVRDKPSLPALSHAELTTAAWDHVAHLAPDLAALGFRALPILSATGPTGDPPDRATMASSLRLGGGPSLEHDDADYAVVRALGRRAGRHVADALPAFSGPIRDRLLPGLGFDDLSLLVDFTEVFGALAARILARKKGDVTRERELFAFASEKASRVVGRGDATDAARTLLSSLVLP